MAMKEGEVLKKQYIVAESDSAVALGSGGLMVFGTPALVAKMEQTALEMVKPDLEEGTDTVGIEINVKHVKATAIGKKVDVEAKIVKVDGRKICYEISATDEAGDVIGTAYHERFVVNKERFMSKL